MTRCLSEYTLLLLYTGEGTKQQWSHLRTCPLCLVCYQRLRGDMDRMERILGGPPPARRLLGQPEPVSHPWLPALATLAATLLVLLWGSLHGRHSADTILVAKTQPQQEAPSRFLGRDIAPALLSIDEEEGDGGDDEEEGDDDEGVENPKPDSAVVAIVVPVVSSAYVQAALEGGWPCEWQGTFHTTGCELPPFPLGLREQ